MKLVFLPKSNLYDFMESVRKFGELHVPLRKDENIFYYGKCENVRDIALDYRRTILPAKKYFFRPVEPLMTFDTKKGYQPVEEDMDKKVVLFGIHPCEINSIRILDLVFGTDYIDNYYFNRRKNTAIVGLSCVPDDLCFCRSMGTDFAEDGFDLFLAELKEGYLVRVGTSRGDDMVNGAKNLFRKPTDAELDEYKQRSNEILKKFTRSISTTDLPEILEMEYDSPQWKELGERCLGCGACSMICPTCYCFNVADEIALGTAGGVRKRTWDSCLFEDYALVAGGHNFRTNRAMRVKLRYLHKQKGFVDRYGRPSCVGCGRCINVCPAKIDVAEVINTIRGAVK